MMSVVDLLTSREMGVPKIRVQMPDGSDDTVDCPLSLLCALVIARGASTAADLEHLVRGSVSIDDLNRAISIVRFASLEKLAGASPPASPAGRPAVSIDVTRILRDGKYALQVQEMISASTMDADAMHRFITSNLKGHVLALTLNSLGCRVIQKLLEVAPLEDALRLVHPELTGKVIECALDVNGNHVVRRWQGILAQSPDASRKWFYCSNSV